MILTEKLISLGIIVVSIGVLAVVSVVILMPSQDFDSSTTMTDQRTEITAPDNDTNLSAVSRKSGSGRDLFRRDQKSGQRRNHEPSSVDAMKQIITTNLQVDSVSAGLDKLTDLSEPEQTMFLQQFFDEMNMDVLNKMLDDGTFLRFLDELPPDQKKFVTYVLSEIMDVPAASITALGSLAKLPDMLGLRDTPVYSIETVVFGTTVTKENKPTGNRTTFKPPEHLIYACFPNQGGLKNLRYIRIEWTNLSSGDVIHRSFKSINHQKLYNYVWVRKNQNWDPGSYEVTLYNLRNMMIAQGNYEIRESG